MAKNMTRKSAAIGAGLALASSAIVAMPAAAVSSITLAPLSGTSTQGVIDLGFVLKATVAGADSSDAIRFAITGYDSPSDVKTKQVKIDSVAGLTGADVDGTSELDGLADASSSDENAEDQLIVDATVDSSNPYALLGIALDGDDVDTTTTLEIFAFSDANTDDIYDADLDEARSETITLTFTPQDEVSVTASQTHDTNANETDLMVSYDGVNMASMIAQDKDGTVGDQIVLQNGVIRENATDDPITVNDFDSDENAFVNAGLNSLVEPGDIITTQVRVGSETDETVVLRDDLSASDVAAYEAISIASSQNYVLDDSGDFKARSGDGQFVVTMVVNDADGVGIAGETVTWTLEEGTNDEFNEDGRITAGGLTLQNEDDSESEKIQPTSVTDADGKASLTISYTDMDDAEDLKISASVEDSSIGADAAKDVTFTDSAAYDVVIANTDDNGALVVALGEDLDLDVSIRDEFGLAPATKSRVKMKVTGGDIDVEKFVEFDANDGDSTFSFTDTSSSAASLTVEIAELDGGNEIEFVDSDGDFTGASYGNAVDDGTPSGASGNIEAKDADDILSATGLNFDTGNSHDIDAGDEEVDIWGNDPATADTRLQTNDDFDTDAGNLVTAAAGSSPENNVLKVALTDVSGLGSTTAGTAVTFSAPAVQFFDKAGEIWGYESLTVYAEADGTAQVTFASNVSGEHTITASSGSLSDTLVVEVADAVEGMEDNLVVNSAPTSVEPGSTYRFKLTVVDEYGNAIKKATPETNSVSMTYEGPGLIVGGKPTEVAADGTISAAILMGTNDSGSHTITITHGGKDQDLSTTSGTDTILGETVSVANLSTSWTFTIGETVGDYGTQKAWTVNQDDGTAKVYVKFPEIDGKLRILLQTGGSGSYDSIYSKTTTSETMDGLRIVEGVGTYVVRTIDLADGTNRIRVSVDGEDIEVNGKDRPARYNE